MQVQLHREATPSMRSQRLRLESPRERANVFCAAVLGPAQSVARPVARFVAVAVKQRVVSARARDAFAPHREVRPSRRMAAHRTLLTGGCEILRKPQMP